VNGEREAQQTHRVEVKGTVIKERMKKLSSVSLAFHPSLSLRHVHGLLKITSCLPPTLLLLIVNSWFIGGSIWSLVGQSMVGMNQMYIFECDSWFKAGPSWSLVATVGL